MAAKKKAPAKKKRTNDKIVKQLNELIKIREKRNAVYHDAHKRKGEVILGLFDGVPLLETENDITRYGLIDFIISKLLRYCENFNEGGHDDSLNDIAIYTQLLRELDEK